ncbi:hypothetical protein JAN5088_01466 [Jannaschia rubra]|uniref:Uncharacterized protein n=1 Tax=Jannaschia rubra TaxID=282197 RepID=A0A0M6XRN6_9RHOB|nr:hypothetical protein [Jannaschia rubra]CTQ32694.1 hypothetical protein JAN5088_01466 [Jannaschia rubra]SFF87640.1 hypothetical protein SAMN04488517_101629 [Jannaschia rubra]
MIRYIACGYGSAAVCAFLLEAGIDGSIWIPLLAFWLGGAIITLAVAWVSVFPPGRGSLAADQAVRRRRPGTGLADGP